MQINDAFSFAPWVSLPPRAWCSRVTEVTGPLAHALDGRSFPLLDMLFPAVILDAVRCQSLNFAALAAFVPLHASMQQCPVYTHPAFANVQNREVDRWTSSIRGHFRPSVPVPRHFTILKTTDYWIRHACRDRDLRGPKAADLCQSMLVNLAVSLFCTVNLKGTSNK